MVAEQVRKEIKTIQEEIGRYTIAKTTIIGFDPQNFVDVCVLNLNTMEHCPFRREIRT